MTRIKLKNIGAFGIAMGKAFISPDIDLSPQKEDSPNAEAQVDIFEKARESATAQIEKLAEKSDIFEAHLNLIKSASLHNGVVNRIRLAGRCAQVALSETSDELANKFEAFDDSYLKERASDIRDICNRIMAALKGVALNFFDEIQEDSIVIASNLAPSDTSDMDFNLVKGLITEAGGITSHTCIIAKTVGIPAAVGQEGILDLVADGSFIIMDCNEAIAIIDPSEEVIAEYVEKMEQIAMRNAIFKEHLHLSAETKDGHYVEVFANVGSIEDVKAAMANGAEGIGLFRTEFLYMHGSDFPTEAEQFKIYQEAAKLCNGKPIIIRTLDIGGDKDLPYFNFPNEDNPFLGWRAIRMCFDMRDIFKAQLRALLRASAHGNIHIMYPMIISVEEVRLANSILQECKEELIAEGIPIGDIVPTGIMVETPSAVMMIDELAKEVDFISIGTNDLTQYMLAVDRGNEKIANMYDSFHPAVLRAIAKVIEVGRKRDVMVGMCGELAGNKNALKTLLGMGLQEFSMSAADIPESKYHIRQFNYTNAQIFAKRVLAAESVTKIKEMLVKEAESIDDIKEELIVKKALIICAAGMSSSVMAKKTTEYFQSHGKEIALDAIYASQGAAEIAKDEYDLYLVSPQTKMYYDNLKKAVDKYNKPIINIPPQAYIPIPMGIEKMAKLIEDSIA